MRAAFERSCDERWSRIAGAVRALLLAHEGCACRSRHGKAECRARQILFGSTQAYTRTSLIRL